MCQHDDEALGHFAGSLVYMAMTAGIELQTHDIKPRPNISQSHGVEVEVSDMTYGKIYEAAEKHKVNPARYIASLVTYVVVNLDMAISSNTQERIFAEL